MRARTKKDGDREEGCWWMSTALRREKRQEVAIESSHVAQWLVRFSETGRSRRISVSEMFVVLVGYILHTFENVE